MRLIRSVLITALAFGLARTACAEPSLEAVRSAAASGFTVEFAQKQFPKFTPGADHGAFAPRMAMGKDGHLMKFDAFMKKHIRTADSAGQILALSSDPAAVLDLATLKNRHISQSSLRYTLSGKTVVVSGGFDRDQNAYVSIKVADGAPAFFNVKGLMNKEETISVGSAKYLLYLSPNIIKPMKSQIVLENNADEDEQVRISIKKLLAAISDAGDTVAVTGQSYKAFYYDDIKDGKLDPSSQSFAFVLTDADGEFHVFLVPSELVGEDKPTTFKMHENKALDLIKAGGKLKIFEK